MKNLSSKNESPDLDFYIQTGLRGHFPLFYSQWIKDSFDSSKRGPKLTLSEAKDTLHHHFKYLSTFRKVEKQRTVIESFSQHERENLIHSFFKVIDHLVLKDQNGLH